MKNKLLLVAFILCMGILGSTVSAKDLKVLMIGNSYSICVGWSLPFLVQAYPEHRLELTSAYIGACSLKRHADNIKAAQEDPEKGQYGITVWNSAVKGSSERYSGNLIDLLKKKRYDIVTIQQASKFSWKWDSYEPYAGELIAFIRQCQPDAEIVIQQTWSYRSDEPLLQSFGFDQNEMYNRLRDAYAKLAEKYKLRVIPMGDAVQLFRKYTPVKYQPPAEKTFEYPKVPSNQGDVVGSATWNQDPSNRKMSVDRIHLNRNGRYLQACLWFSFLYGEPIDKITWVLEGVSQDSAVLLRRCAKEALEAYPQTAGKNEKK